MRKHRLTWIIMMCGIATAVSAQLTDFAIQDTESVWASSFLTETISGRRVEYGPEALFDEKLSTCWAENVPGPGIGENVLVLTQRPVERIRISNGFAKSSYLYHANNRPRELEVSVVAGLTAPGMVTEQDVVLYKVLDTQIDSPLQLADSRDEHNLVFPVTLEEQYRLMRDAIETFRTEEPFLFGMLCRELRIDPEAIDLDSEAPTIIEAYGFYAIRFTIASVYPGDRYDDTCVSEISLELGTF